jgi:hypothetical protein
MKTSMGLGVECNGAEMMNETKMNAVDTEDEYCKSRGRMHYSMVTG